MQFHSCVCFEMESCAVWYIIYIVFSFESLCRAKAVGNGDTMTNRICENTILNLQCANNDTINVISANYGRTSSLYCPGPNSERTADCILDSSLEIVQNECQGKSTCNIFATNLAFETDPCNGVFKYLEVNYTCVTERVSCNNLKCNETTEVCVDDNDGAMCMCAENYTISENENCQAITCSNSVDSCNGTAERCEDGNPGINCMCKDNYTRNSSGLCTAVTCDNSKSLICDDTEVCEDLNPGIQCTCPKNYYRATNKSCAAISCLNTDHMCDTITEICEDLKPGFRCVCTEGYTKDIDDNCRPIPTEMGGNERTTETPENMPVCPAEVIVIGGISLSFSLAKTGEELNSNETCIAQSTQNQSQSLATRVCNGVWQEPNLQNCFNEDTPQKQLDVLLQLNLTDANVGEFSRSFAILTYQIDDITVQILEFIIEYLAKIVALGSASFEVTDAVIGIVGIIMQINEEILAKAKGVASVIPLMEEQISNVHRNGRNYTQAVPYIDVSALQVPKMILDDDLTFISYSTYATENTEDEDLVQETSITVPSSVLQLIDKVYPNTTTVPISFVTYQDPRLFRKNDNQASDDRNVTEEYIGSYVISSTVELPNVTIRDLPQNSSVIIRFSDLMLNERDNTTEMEALCVFWKYTSESGEGEWSQTGCRKLLSGFEDVTCSCDHLTSFAVLVRTYDEMETDLHLALQLISIIGCIISVIGLSLSLICMIILRSVRVKQQTHIHFNLCLALLGLYLSFLFGIGQADQPETCRRMTSVIYFFCLSSMAWMSVEAFYIYKLIWKYKQYSIKRLIPVGVLFAWGVPGIAAVVIYFVDNTHNYEAEPDYCFLHPGHVLLYGFLLELLILFLYNSIVFVLVTYRISCRKIRVWNKEDRRQELITRLKSTLLFWLLLGVSWIFGFLATFEQPASFVFQIIFCVLLSLQGFFMFYMLIVQNPEMKKSLSSASTLRLQAASLQLGARSSAALSTKKQSQQENPASFDQLNDKTHV